MSGDKGLQLGRGEPNEARSEPDGGEDTAGDEPGQLANAHVQSPCRGCLAQKQRCGSVTQSGGTIHAGRVYARGAHVALTLCRRGESETRLMQDRINADIVARFPVAHSESGSDTVEGTD